MPRPPAISVVVGAYNAQKYIDEMVRSILAQTFTDFEFILVDDGSTDHTLKILRGYEKQDARVKVIACPHRGIVDAANAGIGQAQCELIARADADDVALPQRFEKQLQYMQEHPEIAALGAQMLLIDPYGVPLLETKLPLDHEGIENEMLGGSGWAMPQPVAMVRRSAVMQIGCYRKEYEWAEDLDLFLRLAEHGRLANLPDVLVKYRIHLQSTNHTRYRHQLVIKRVLVAEAYQRRGLTMPDNWDFTPRKVLPPDQQYRHWAWKALAAGCLPAARRHALSALRCSPLNRQSWIATFRAFRGS